MSFLKMFSRSWVTSSTFLRCTLWSCFPWEAKGGGWKLEIKGGETSLSTHYLQEDERRHNLLATFILLLKWIWYAQHIFHTNGMCTWELPLSKFFKGILPLLLHLQTKRSFTCRFSACHVADEDTGAVAEKRDIPVLHVFCSDYW